MFNYCFLNRKWWSIRYCREFIKTLIVCQKLFNLVSRWHS